MSGESHLKRTATYRHDPYAFSPLEDDPTVDAAPPEIPQILEYYAGVSCEGQLSTTVSGRRHNPYAPLLCVYQGYQGQSYDKILGYRAGVLDEGPLNTTIGGQQHLANESVRVAADPNPNEHGNEFIAHDPAAAVQRHVNTQHRIRSRRQQVPVLQPLIVDAHETYPADSYKTTLCAHAVSGECRLSVLCGFAHDWRELRTCQQNRADREAGRYTSSPLFIEHMFDTTPGLAEFATQTAVGACREEFSAKAVEAAMRVFQNTLTNYGPELLSSLHKQVRQLEEDIASLNQRGSLTRKQRNELKRKEALLAANGDALKMLCLINSRPQREMHQVEV